MTAEPQRAQRYRSKMPLQDFCTIKLLHLNSRLTERRNHTIKTKEVETNCSFVSRPQFGGQLVVPHVLLWVHPDIMKGASQVTAAGYSR